MINYTNLPKPFIPIVRAVEILNSSEINCLILKSRTGLGKSYWVDYALKDSKANYVIFKGYVSEARFYKFIQDNSDKIIVMRDCGSMLKSKTFLDFLKSATDMVKSRKISRLTYAEHEDLEDETNFTGKVIWELNDLPDINSEDLAAVISRSIYIELNLSVDDISIVMRDIAVTDFEKEVTSYLITFATMLGVDFNLRTQNMCFKIAEIAVRDKINWMKEIDMFLVRQIPESRKLLYTCAGNNSIKRLDFVRFLMREMKWSYATAQRRIREWL
jgi:hypothetical protein